MYVTCCTSSLACPQRGTLKTNAKVLNVCQIVYNLCAVLCFPFLFSLSFFLFFSLCCCALSCALLHDFLSTLCCCCSLLPSLLGLTQILSVAARRKTLPKVLIWLRTFNVAQLAGWQQTAASRFSLIVQFSVSCLFWAAAVPLPLFSPSVAVALAYVQESLV